MQVRWFRVGVPQANRLAGPFWVWRPTTQNELFKVDHLNRTDARLGATAAGVYPSSSLIIVCVYPGGTAP